MNRLERFYKIDQLLQEFKLVSREQFLENLEISLATFKRDLEYMRDRFNAPVIWDSELRGYRYESHQNNNQKFTLPGLWFSEEEALALITMQHLLENLDQGSLIGPHIAPFLSRIDAIISEGESTSKEIRKRIKLITTGSRKQSNSHFSEIGAALFKRQRIEIVYYGRTRDDITSREISPQRLVHYRDNWYLDAWCHLRNGLRGFSIDNIKSVQTLSKKAIDTSAKALNEELGSSYGIFAGQSKFQAKLRFSADRAKWVAAETWHINQISSYDDQGRYILEFPFSDDRELLLDILRHGAAVEVISPKSLRDKVNKEYQAASNIYK